MSRTSLLSFPSCVYDENGTKIKCNTGELIKVDLKSNDVAVFPWNKKRFIDNIIYLRGIPFKYDNLNHMSYFYTYIDLCYVYNGNHSICSGIYYKKGKIKSEVFKLELLFDHIYSDGLYWYNSHTNEKLYEVEDFRVAVIFEIAKLKYKFEQKISEENNS